MGTAGHEQGNPHAESVCHINALDIRIIHIYFLTSIM